LFKSEMLFVRQIHENSMIPVIRRILHHLAAEQIINII
jgi:hypothetical protein